jgi:Bifunctional DNA primase/polymerase, N-terminal
VIEHVRKYVSWGIPVFPVHYPQDGGCSCKLGPQCENVGKHPMTRNGVDDATLDLVELEAVWARYPRANIGLATGHAMEVLDLDTPESIGALQDVVGMFADQDPPMVSTGKGYHVWYRPIGGKNRARMVPGVDWRGLGGYVLAPPSMHASGVEYRWSGGPFETMPAPPAKLADLVLRQGDHAQPDKPKLKLIPPVGSTVLDRLDMPDWSDHGLVTRIAEAIEGERNTVLHWAACRLYEDAVNDECEPEQLEQGLARIFAAALEVGLGEIEIEGTIRSARNTYAMEDDDGPAPVRSADA